MLKSKITCVLLLACSAALHASDAQSKEQLVTLEKDCYALGIKIEKLHDGLAEFSALVQGRPASVTRSIDGKPQEQVFAPPKDNHATRREYVRELHVSYVEELDAIDAYLTSLENMYAKRRVVLGQKELTKATLQSSMLHRRIDALQERLHRLLCAY